MPGGTYSVTTVGSISAALSVGGGRSAGSFPEQQLVISVHYNNYIWSTYPMTTTVRRSHINFINKIIIIIIIRRRRRRRRRRRSKTVGISVKQTFVPTNQTIYCIVLLSFAFVICCSFLEPSGPDSHLPNICCKSVRVWYRFPIMQIMNVIYFSTVILSLNMVYFKSTALFMHNVTINLVPPNKSSLLEPKSATIDFIASFLDR